MATVGGYAAVTAARLGLSAGILTSHADDFPLELVPPQGLRVKLSIPLQDKNQQGDAAPATARAPVTAHPAVASHVLSGNRVLLVEDEALVAMVMRDMLTEFGFVVVGPFGRPDEATAAARSESFDAAFLDVNLGGEMVYAIADLLTARKIPFAFVTGYGAESIDGRFAEVPVLQKPVERAVLEGVFAVNGACTNGSGAVHQEEGYGPRPDIAPAPRPAQTA